MDTETVINTETAIKWLTILAEHPDLGLLTAGDNGATSDALICAIRAVKLLEQIKADTRGNCLTCAYIKRDTSDVPCLSCFNGEVSGWGFRWPLTPEKENNHETH